MLRKHKKPTITTVEEFERHQRGGGSPPEHNHSLWDEFNDAVSHLTASIRRKARFALKAKLDSPDYSSAEKQVLHRRFNEIVDGGIKGALSAVKTLWFEEPSNRIST